MVECIHSVSVTGLSGVPVSVEVDVATGLSAFTIVGLWDMAVQESRERVRSAIKNAGFTFPGSKRITVNLAPADVRKKWPSFDLPIALGILSHEFLFKKEFFKESIFIWELALNGKIRSIDGILPSVLFARENKIKYIFLPKDASIEAGIVPDVHIIPVESLQETISILVWEIPIPASSVTSFEQFSRKKEIWVDIESIIGQEHAKRSILIAASGGHNILLEWPPGSWKTMLAKWLASLLPPMSLDEIIEVSGIYSVAGLLSRTQPLIIDRPFRSIHHTASEASIIGWGRDSRPGEISLAHKWVLFLDEFLEFDKNVLETLRQPLEDGVITINRVHASCRYPAKFMLIWALNPCPCWYLWDKEKSCTCSQSQIERYKSKLSWPMLDRIDIMIRVPRVKPEDFEKYKNKASIHTRVYMQEKILWARTIQLQRFINTNRTYNAEMSNAEIETYCILGDDGEKFLQDAINRLWLSTRVYFRILRLARTIADLDASEHILLPHIAEAISYRW